MSRFASPSPVIKTELLHVIAGPPAPRTQPMCAETDRTWVQLTNGLTVA